MKSDSLELIELSVARDGAELIPPFTQRLSGGEVLVVRGRNGSGKSSLLKCIAGLLPPASGEIRWGGVPIAKNPAYPQGVLYLGHKRGLNHGMSVYDNVAFWAKIHGQPELIKAALHYFDLADIADVPLHTLSAGWQQRVALTRLITVPSALWLLDEPAANLDDDGVNHLNGIMESRTEQGGIVVLATHSPVQGDRTRLLDLNDFRQISATIVEAA